MIILGIDPGIKETAISVISINENNGVRVLTSIRIRPNAKFTNTEKLHQIFESLKSQLFFIKAEYELDWVGVEVPCYIGLKKERITRDLVQRDVTMVCRLAVTEVGLLLFNSETNNFIAPITVHSVPPKDFPEYTTKKLRVKEWIKTFVPEEQKRNLLISDDQYDSIGIAIAVYKKLNEKNKDVLKKFYISVK